MIKIGFSRWGTITGMSVLSVLLVIWGRSARRSKKLVYGNWWRGRIRQCNADVKSLGNLALAGAILDAVERHILPMTCSGVVSGEPLCGACVLLTSTGEVISASSSQELSFPLYNAEVLALEEASLILKASNLAFSDCTMVSTHRMSLLDGSSLGLPLCKKLGITKIYALFDHTSKIDETGREYAVAFATPNETPEGVLSGDDSKMMGNIEIVPLWKLIGEINTRGREYESEAELHQQMAIDKEVLKLQTRLQNLHRVYLRLNEEMGQGGHT